MATSGMRSLLSHHHHHHPPAHHLRPVVISRLLCSRAFSHRHGHNLHHRHRHDHQAPPALGPLRLRLTFGFPPAPWKAAGAFSSSSSPSRRPTRSAAGSVTSSSPKPQRSSSTKPKKERVQKPKPEPTFNVPVILEDSLDSNPELEALLEQLEHDGPLAVKLAVDGMDNLVPSETVELSLLICDDAYICNLNKEWRGENSPTDVLSFPQDQPPGVSSIMLLGDVIISLDTAKRQAQERSHGVLDEVRILLVHGLLHVLGYDHEEGQKAAVEMEKEELRILQGLGWNSKGLITASGETQPPSTNEESKNYAVKSKGTWKRRPLFRVLLCDMDGTLLNGRSKITEKTAAALKEAVERGVKVIIATGKTRPAVITACQPVGLVGEKGVVSESSPGVFVQGLLVYGQHGKVVHNQLLNPDVCIKAFQYSLEQKQPLIGFSGDRAVTLFDHPLIEQLHTVYMEPKAEVAPSLEHLIENFQIQKLLFADTAERISSVIRPYWSQETRNLARVVQAQDDMLEIIPVGSSKGKGVALLLDNLGVHPDDVMAIGDGENDIEMLKLVGWGVAMGNGAAQTLAVADARVASNDEDGVVEALERFVLT